MNIKVDYLICKDETLTTEIDNVYGFFQINIAGNLYGYCPENGIGLVGSELLSIWFEQLTEVYCLIHNKDYILINDIDSINSLIEIKKYNESLLEISHIVSNSKDEIGVIGLKPLDYFEYGLWKNICIERECFSREVYRVINQFVSEVSDINPLYLEANWLTRIISIMKRAHIKD
ncbi:hypothetical protein ACFSTH_07030 [Paenibacillus yanchengensis]|uniref:Uncharacterized protein n=1 Tax=Paenibacillus yanchengensis TaxID=2035833 RepID=A0ABW4YHP1_9BACL